MGAITFWRADKKLKNYGTFKHLLTQYCIGLGSWKCKFHLISDKFHDGITYRDRIKAITSLGNRWTYNTCVNLFFLTWGQWTNGKKSNILNRRTKLMNSLESRHYKIHWRGTFHGWFFEFGVIQVWGHLVHFTNFGSEDFKRVLLESNFHQISPNETLR